MQPIQKIGPYEILHELGQGALAVVYAARDPKLNREVALKVLHPIFSKNRNNIERLKQEAQTLAQLRHPNIIHIYEFIDEPEAKGIVTEYIEGETLAKFLEDHKIVFPEIAVLIIANILSALEHAHSKRIIHRDIKPQNIIISREGEIKLADFSIAKLMDKECLTLTGQLIGSPFFMSPEQANGEKIDERSDIFTTGILFYNLLTGQLPFADEDQKGVLKKIMETSFNPPRKLNRQISEELEAIVLKALSKDKQMRYQKAWEFRYAILKYLQKNGIPYEDIPLKDFFADPHTFTEQFKSKLTDLLLENSKKAAESKNYGEASQVWNRILEYDPKNKIVEQQIQQFSKSKRFTKIKVAALLIPVVAGVVVFHFAKERIDRSLSSGGIPTGEARVAQVRGQPPPARSQAKRRRTAEGNLLATGPAPFKSTTSKPISAVVSKWAYLQINMDPDTEFLLDGKKIRVDKANPVPVRPGAHTIWFKKTSFRDIKTTIVLKAGETSTINIRRGS